MPSKCVAAGISPAPEARGGWERGQHSSAETRTCQLISPSASQGGNGHPQVGTALAKGRSWKPSVSSCRAWKQPWGPGATVLGAHTGFSIFVCRSGSPSLHAGKQALRSSGSKILVNYCEANSVRNFRNKIWPHDPTSPVSRPCSTFLFLGTSLSLLHGGAWLHSLPLQVMSSGSALRCASSGPPCVSYLPCGSVFL